ncbi:50S ribosomal protein L32 [Candidatus Zinderia endosymbiont of Aphrophora alni]|uniref:50S ribosomal protein L32 n=1 Tax=Candidatus Zinderia endosymbiont of Aphrophora alni TaxID=3077951 RepID=UPI0030CCB6DE
MAVQQNKKTPSKRGMRRSHDNLKINSLSINKISNEIHIRHHISKKGFYRKKRIFCIKNKK